MLSQSEPPRRCNDIAHTRSTHIAHEFNKEHLNMCNTRQSIFGLDQRISFAVGLRCVKPPLKRRTPNNDSNSGNQLVGYPEKKKNRADVQVALRIFLWTYQLTTTTEGDYIY